MSLLQSGFTASGAIDAAGVELHISAAGHINATLIEIEQSSMTAGGNIDVSNALISLGADAMSIETVSLVQSGFHSDATVDLGDAAIEIVVDGTYSGSVISVAQTDVYTAVDISADMVSIDVNAGGTVSVDEVSLLQSGFTASGDIDAHGAYLHISASGDITASLIELEQSSMTAGGNIDLSNAMVSLGATDFTVGSIELAQGGLSAGGTIDAGDAAIWVVADSTVADGTFSGSIVEVSQYDMTAGSGDISLDFANIVISASGDASVTVVAIEQVSLHASGEIDAHGASILVSAGGSLVAEMISIDQGSMTAGDAIDLSGALIDVTVEGGVTLDTVSTWSGGIVIEQASLYADSIDASDAHIYLSAGRDTAADTLSFEAISIWQHDMSAVDIVSIADATIDIEGLNRDVVPNDTMVGGYVVISQGAVTAPIIDAHGATISISGNQISLGNVFISQDLTATSTLDVSDAQIHIGAWGTLHLDALPMIYHSTLQNGGLYNASGVQVHITAQSITVGDADSTLLGFSYNSIVDGSISLADNLVAMTIDDNLNFSNGLGSGSAISAFIEMTDLHATLGDIDGSGAGLTLEAEGTFLASFVPSIELHDLTASGDVSIGGAEIDIRVFDDIIIDSTSSAAWIDMTDIVAGGDILGANVHLHISAGGTLDATAVGITMDNMTADGLIDLSGAEVHLAASELDVTLVTIEQVLMSGGTIDISDALIDIEAHLIPAVSHVAIFQAFSSAAAGDFDASGATITISVDGDATFASIDIIQIADSALIGTLDASNALINISAMGGATLAIDSEMRIYRGALEGSAGVDLSSAHIVVDGIETDEVADITSLLVAIDGSSITGGDWINDSDALIDIEGGTVSIGSAFIHQALYSASTALGAIDMHGAAITLHADTLLSVSLVEIVQQDITAHSVTLGGGGIDVSGATVWATLIDIRASDITAHDVTFDAAVLRLESDIAGFTVAHDLAIDLTVDASILEFSANEISVYSGLDYTADHVTIAVTNTASAQSLADVDDQYIGITAVGSVIVDGFVGIEVTADAVSFDFSHNVIDILAGAANLPLAPINGAGIEVDRVGFLLDDGTGTHVTASWNTIDLSAPGDITVLHDVSLHVLATAADHLDVSNNLIDIEAGTVFMASYVGVHVDAGVMVGAQVSDNTIEISAGTSISVGEIDSGHLVGGLTTFDFGNDVTLDAPHITVGTLDMYGYLADLFIVGDHVSITSLDVGSAQAEIYLDRYTSAPHPDYNITIYDFSVAMNSGLGDRLGTGGDGGGFDQIDLYGLGITSASQLSHTFVGGFVETGGGGNDWTIADILIHATAANSSLTIDLKDVHLNYTDYSLAPSNAQVWDDLIANALRFQAH